MSKLLNVFLALRLLGQLAAQSPHLVDASFHDFEGLDPHGLGGSDGMDTSGIYYVSGGHWIVSNLVLALVDRTQPRDINLRLVNRQST